MPKLKITDDELDVEGLEEAEYNGDFEPYDGPEPPAKIVLSGYVKRLYWTYTAPKPDPDDPGEDPMIKVLFIAANNTGERSKYNGWGQWDNIVIKASSKFRWKPFLDALGVTLRELKSKTIVEAEDDERFGAPIVSIAKWKPGEDQDGAYVRVLTKRERYQGETSTKLDRWLEYGETEDDEDEEDEELVDEEEVEEEEIGPEGEEEDDEDEEEADEEEEEEEEEEEPTPPAKNRGGRRTAAAQAKSSSVKPARTAAKPAAKKPAATTRRAAAKPAAAKRATSKPAARGGRRRASDDDPPF